MELKIFDCQQGSADWYAARCGKITASCFQDALAKPTKGFAVNAYAYKVASERVRGMAAEHFSSQATERGHTFEPVVRGLYETQTGNTVALVGFMARGNIGGSADGLVGEDGMIEIKTADAHIQISTLMQQEIPEKHIAQVQGNLWISGRKWCDYISYCEGLPLFIKRAERDETFIAKLETEIPAFDEKVNEIVTKILTMY